jgi:hypothetical protein
MPTILADRLQEIAAVVEQPDPAVLEVLRDDRMRYGFEVGIRHAQSGAVQLR